MVKVNRNMKKPLKGRFLRANGYAATIVKKTLRAVEDDVYIMEFIYPTPINL
jgi:hypothetical protein